jgi:hypothetical protein
MWLICLLKRLLYAEQADGDTKNEEDCEKFPSRFETGSFGCDKSHTPSHEGTLREGCVNGKWPLGMEMGICNQIVSCEFLTYTEKDIH